LYSPVLQTVSSLVKFWLLLHPNTVFLSIESRMDEPAQL
jgi:hypothetical protein